MLLVNFFSHSGRTPFYEILSFWVRVGFGYPPPPNHIPYFRVESNIHAKSNMGAKCVWASFMVFEEKMGQAKSKQGKKKGSN